MTIRIIRRLLLAGLLLGAGPLAWSLESGDPEGAAGMAADSSVRAGVGVVDMTPAVGYCAGQYCDTSNLFDGLAGGDIDPYGTHKAKHASYGVQSRLTARAIVVEGSNGKRVALIKTDNYLAQDALMRRVGQILRERGSSIGYEQLLHSASHNHSSAYSSTPSWGVWIFQDIFDPRFFEHQARKIAEAVLTAEVDLQPARMGATTVRHTIFKGNVVGLATADDGTPAGYPLEYGDHGLVVMRFDALTEAGPEPLAVWVNYGQHPESLEGHNLHTADFLSALERHVDREIGAPLIFTQGDVGSAERSGNKTQLLDDDGKVCGHWPENEPAPTENACPPGQGALRVTFHTDFAQYERLIPYMADDIVKGWERIGAGDPSVQVPLSTDFPVDWRSYWAPGPVSHPYPAVSNCNTQQTAEGDVGVPIVGLPDCGRFGFPGENEFTNQAGIIYATMKAEGAPAPDHYDAPAFTGVEENLRIYLQAFRLGEVLLASCACEAQVDLILNLETRADNIAGNIYNGFDWACLMDEYRDDPQYVQACEIQRQYYDPEEFPTPVPGTEGAKADPERIARMRAQVHNDARGWDAMENAAHANSEPAELDAIWGNFTHEELPPEQGYALPVGLGHAGDYVGYTVSYREFMNRDHYRKALTSYGAHTADYMVTRLVRMAGAMKGGPALEPEPHDGLAQADEARQVAQNEALGVATRAAHDAWLAALPLDSGPAEALVQPESITHFDAATFRWRGGSTQIDNPVAVVQRRVDGEWRLFADMSGEVQTRVHWPAGLPGVIASYTGQFSWEWTANFEAYRAFPARLGNTPLGDYRFVVSGCINDNTADPEANLGGRVAQLAPPALAEAGLLDGLACPGGSRRYELASEPFMVEPQLGPVPRSYASAFAFVEDKADSAGRDSRICETCSFLPWATATFAGIADSDGDGVNDALDLCPDTPPGRGVDEHGCALVEPVTVVAELQVTPAGGVAPVTATFDASGSQAPDGAIYRFEFSDGGVQEGAGDTATRVYMLAGEYSVTLTVTDPDEAANSDTATATLTVGSGQQTTAQLVVSPSDVRVGEEVRFDASASIAGEGREIMRFRFEFGDGEAVERSVAEFGDAAAVVFHAYQRAGNYAPRVTVRDDANASQQASAKLRVRLPPPEGPVTGEPGPGEPPGPRASGSGAPGLLLLPLLLLAARRRRGLL